GAQRCSRRPAPEPTSVGAELTSGGDTGHSIPGRREESPESPRVAFQRPSTRKRRARYRSISKLPRNSRIPTAARTSGLRGSGSRRDADRSRLSRATGFERQTFPAKDREGKQGRARQWGRNSEATAGERR